MKIGCATEPATIEWCTTREHPIITYNPWLDVSCCRCGEVAIDGEHPMDWQAKHEVFHAREKED